MRPAIVLAILGLALAAMMLLRREHDASFDARFANAQERISALADGIEDDLDGPDQEQSAR